MKRTRLYLGNKMPQSGGSRYFESATGLSSIALIVLTFSPTLRREEPEPGRSTCAGISP